VEQSLKAGMLVGAGREVNMINFEEEIAKFQPSLEVEQAEDVINNNDLSDITDIIKTMLKDLKGN
jgi:hypothetical protein